MNAALQNTGDLAMSQANMSAVDSFARKGSGRNVDEAAKDFEGMFVAQMLQPMFDTVKVNSMFGGGHGEEMMRGFMTQEYGKAIAKTHSFGIAASVRAELIRVQEHKSSAQNPTPFKGDVNAAQPAQ